MLHAVPAKTGSRSSPWSGIEWRSKKEDSDHAGELNVKKQAIYGGFGEWFSFISFGKWCIL